MAEVHDGLVGEVRAREPSHWHAVLPRRNRDPAGRFEKRTKENVDDGWSNDDPDSGLDFDLNDALLQVATVVVQQNARSIIARNGSPDVPFEQSSNPYQGCEHGCVYCYCASQPCLPPSVARN